MLANQKLQLVRDAVSKGKEDTYCLLLTSTEAAIHPNMYGPPHPTTMRTHTYKVTGTQCSLNWDWCCLLLLLFLPSSFKGTVISEAGPLEIRIPVLSSSETSVLYQG